VQEGGGGVVGKAALPASDELHSRTISVEVVDGHAAVDGRGDIDAVAGRVRGWHPSGHVHHRLAGARLIYPLLPDDRVDLGFVGVFPAVIRAVTRYFFEVVVGIEHQPTGEKRGIAGRHVVLVHERILLVGGEVLGPDSHPGVVIAVGLNGDDLAFRGSGPRWALLRVVRGPVSQPGRLTRASRVADIHPVDLVRPGHVAGKGQPPAIRRPAGSNVIVARCHLVIPPAPNVVDMKRQPVAGRVRGGDVGELPSVGGKRRHAREEPGRGNDRPEGADEPDAIPARVGHLYPRSRRGESAGGHHDHQKHQQYQIRMTSLRLHQTPSLKVRQFRSGFTRG